MKFDEMEMSDELVTAENLKKLGYVRTAVVLERNFRQSHSHADLNALYVLLSSIEDDKEVYMETLKALSKDMRACVISWAKRVNDTIFPLSMKNNSKEDEGNSL